MKGYKYLGLMAISVLAMACTTSTKITSSWTAPERNLSQKSDKILVLAMLPEKDRPLRESIERELTRSLQLQGYQAISSYEAFGPKSFTTQDEKQVMIQMQDLSIQRVITVALLDKEKERKYTPGRVDYYPSIGFNPFWRRYVYYYDRVYNPGYYVNTTNYYVESNLYDVGSNRLLYSVQSKTFDPASVEDLARTYSKAIVKDMEQKRVIS